MSYLAHVAIFIPPPTEAFRPGIYELSGQSQAIVLNDAFVLSTASELISVWKIDQWLRNTKKREVEYE